MAYALEIRELSFDYHDGTQALNDVSLVVEPKERLGIIGPNGAGKSTLLLHLNGILPEKLNSQPHIFIDGIPLIKENLHRIRRKTGLVFQDPDDQLFSPTVYDDVAFGPLNQELESEEVKRRVDQALECVRVKPLSGRMPHHLSFGERKKICLAGVLACEPEILALDEPTSNMDPKSRRDYIELIGRLNKTILVATHDLEMVLELCTRVVLLDGGKIIAGGEPREIMSQSALMLDHGLEIPASLRK